MANLKEVEKALFEIEEMIDRRGKVLADMEEELGAVSLGTNKKDEMIECLQQLSNEVRSTAEGLRLQKHRLDFIQQNATNIP